MKLNFKGRHMIFLVLFSYKSHYLREIFETLIGHSISNTIWFVASLT